MPSGMEYEVCWEGGTMIERFSDLSADGLGPMEHTVAEYPVVRGSSPRDGWRRLGCAFTASTASALAILLVTTAPNGAKAQASAPAMIPPAAQAVAASGSSKGAPLFVAADSDLVAKEGVAQDSWFVVGHLTSGSNRLDLLVHYIRLTPPQVGPVIQAIVSVLDPVSGKSLAEEKDYKDSETTFSAASLDVRTPSGGLTGRASGMHLSGQFSRVQLDLMLAQQGPLLANLGTGMLPFYGDINYEYALPNMKTAGSLVVDGKRYQEQRLRATFAESQVLPLQQRERTMTNKILANITHTLNAFKIPFDLFPFG